MAKKTAASRRTRRRAETGAVYTFRVHDGRYGACQVLALDEAKDQAELATLDYLAPCPPTVEHVATLKVFRRAWANWKGEPARCFVDARVPWWLERVAVIAPLETFETECRAYGGWWSEDVYVRERWEAGARRAWKFEDTEIAIDIGEGPVNVRRDSSQVSIGPGQRFACPTKSEVVFEALDVLPCLTTLTVTGHAPGVLAYVIGRKIETVGLMAHGLSTIDLRASRVHTLSLDVGEAPVTILAPSCLDQLTVRGPTDRLTVSGARTEFTFRLHVQAPAIAAPPRGLEDVQRLELTGLRETDLGSLAHYPRLAELTIRGAPGKVTDASALARLTNLRELAVYEMYALDTGRWPSDLPTLEGLRIHGLCKSDADALKIAAARVPDVRITGARTDAWIATNLDNPFRAWEDDAPAFGRAACKAWNKAMAEATKLGTNAVRADARRVVETLVATLNTLDAKFGIDTVRREEAADACVALARGLGVADDEAIDWFDGARDF